MNHSEIAAVNEQRAARGGQAQLLHGGYMVVQNLQEKQSKTIVAFKQGMVTICTIKKVYFEHINGVHTDTLL